MLGVTSGTSIDGAAPYNSLSSVHTTVTKSQPLNEVATPGTITKAQPNGDFKPAAKAEAKDDRSKLEKQA